MKKFLFLQYEKGRFFTDSAQYNQNSLINTKRRRAEARLPFPPAPRLRAFRMRERL